MKMKKFHTCSNQRNINENKEMQFPHLLIRAKCDFCFYFFDVYSPMSSEKNKGDWTALSFRAAF